MSAIARIIGRGPVPTQLTLDMMKPPRKDTWRVLQTEPIERGQKYVSTLVVGGEVPKWSFFDIQSDDVSTIHPLWTTMMKLIMFTREVALASRLLKSKVFRGPLFLSEKRTDSTRQDARLRKDRFLTKALSSHGKMFVSNLGSALEKHLSETIEEDLRKGGVGSDSFLRDVYYMQGGRWVRRTTVRFWCWLPWLFSRQVRQRSCQPCASNTYIELNKVRKRLFYVDTYMLKVIGQVLEAEHKKFISNIVGYVMGANPETFEKKARSDSRRRCRVIFAQKPSHSEADDIAIKSSATGYCVAHAVSHGKALRHCNRLWLVFADAHSFGRCGGNYCGTHGFPHFRGCISCQNGVWGNEQLGFESLPAVKRCAELSMDTFSLVVQTKGHCPLLVQQFLVSEGCVCQN